MSPERIAMLSLLLAFALGVLVVCVPNCSCGLEDPIGHRRPSIGFFSGVLDDDGGDP